MVKIRRAKKQTKKPAPDTHSQEVKKTRIRVIGIGGGGGTIVSELAARVKKASFVAANTDKQALRTLNRSVLPFQFGESLTHGLGTGMNQELARTAALSEKERIKKLFEGYDFCILVSALGGGAGSGASPVFAKEAKNSGVLTLGVFTLPFNFEGGKKQDLARESLQKIRPSLNAISILPNDRIFQVIEKSTPLKDALSFTNKNLAESLEGLIETIYLPGLINIDFADLKAVLQGQGKIAYLNTVELGGDNRAAEAVKKVLNSPLYPYTIRGAKKVLFNITGDKELLLSDVSGISKMIFEQVFSQAQIIFGISQSESSKDKIKISVLATGCSAKIFTNGEQPETVKKAQRKKRRKPKTHKPKHIPQPQPKPKPKPKPRPKPKKVEVKVEVEEEKEPVVKKEEAKIRKSALQVKEEAKEQEKELLEKEKFWEAPAFLRRTSR